jgi:hypothetical protein
MHLLPDPAYLVGKRGRNSPGQPDVARERAPENNLKICLVCKAGTR